MRRYTLHNALKSTEEGPTPPSRARHYFKPINDQPSYGMFNTSRRNHRPKWCGGGVLMIVAPG